MILLQQKDSMFALGNRENNLHLALASDSSQTPVTLETSDGFLIKVDKKDVLWPCDKARVFG